jgi:hypothetical protein
MAIGDGVVSLNPTGSLYTTACKPSAEKRVMSREDIVLTLKTLNLREGLILDGGVRRNAPWGDPRDSGWEH